MKKIYKTTSFSFLLKKKEGRTKGKKLINSIQQKHYIRLFFPFFSAIIAFLLQIIVPTSSEYTQEELPYYTYFTIICLVITAIASVYYLVTKRNQRYLYKAYFTGVSFLVLASYNLVTLKFSILKVLFFPSPERILNVFVKDFQFILECVAHSSALLGLGLLFGITTGLLTGILIGWNKNWNYWLDPIVKVLGPIPSTAFVPVALSAFATSYQASVFLIALSVWFPVTVLTNSGISNVKNSFFEVASTLGATEFQKVIKVAIPGALPNIFVGLFNGTVSSFLTLMTAEMLGVKYGIGWYINWQREIMGYANVYAGLITIAIWFSLIITILFKIRDHFLKWQKGFIRW
ncbi:ABC transporter permease [Enterococcus saccharolyticus]|uniref:ABC transmembrane type-1 domain-containing protein n=1 Tax=Enterococcus saccharolyticus subsp. saccharolyticus ATCC 43076 TaxID=1139996 RepID=S0NWF5_9ENTE|nr:ABC transporter permease subunit [Enterococcus saccharolyticus]EOT29975.1 hypothetical protein OMQ_00667 [Enterococcus saccharolyticus subsp. saccharolyticus ATCC 43076]EOT80521.1 hypothetical protein I572_01048 [Enterococcus saccharolyticus subsp. saccharolyticus ATCC 43076]OJG90061.1 hypothetical protein RV16_GL001871 [Enterococcus saccharolyticus]